MTVIRQSTARTILVGPILDADGVAKTSGIVVGDIKVTKNGTVGAAHGSTTLTHDHTGKWKLAMNAGDSDTVGVLEISLNSGTNDMPVKTLNVIEEAVYDAMYAASAAGPLQSTTAARKLTVTANGATSINWGQIENPSADVTLDGTEIDNVLTVASIVPSTASNVTTAHSTTDGLIAAVGIQADRNADLIESQRGSHTWQGDVYYVDPVNGNDSTGDGTRALPYATLQAAHDDLVTNNNHDVIFLVSGAASGATTHTVAATTTISKNYVFIRGPGRNFIITRTGSGDTLAVTGDGVEISGVRIGTAATGSGDGIDITDADFAKIHHCWFLDTQGDGVHILRGSNCRIHNNDFDGTGVAGSGDGIHIVGTAGSSNGNSIFDNEMHGTGGDAILIEQGTTNDTLIYGNDIHDAGGWGINIGASSTRAVVYSNILGNNSSGDITDSGSNSIIKNNNAWLYSTTEGRSLDVTATGAAGLDWANVENQGTAVDLSATDIQLCDTITTYTGNTKQTGNNFTRIGAAGASLTDLGGMSTGMKAEVESEANDALVALNLDHLMKTAVGNNADMSTEVVDGTVLSNIMSSSSDTSTYVVADDSLQGISEGAAGGGATAQQVWEYGTRVLTANTNFNDLDAAGIRAAVGLSSANLDTQLADIPTVAEFEARTLVAASYFDPANDTVTTDAASRTASKADVSGLATSAALATHDGKLDTVDGIVDAILVDSNELQTNQGNWLTATGFAVAGDAMVLTSAGLDSIVIESGLNARQALSIIASSGGGVLAGAATNTVTIAAAGVAATNRITATVDANGNRSVVTLDPPA